MAPINNGGHTRWKIFATDLRTTVKSNLEAVQPNSRRSQRHFLQGEQANLSKKYCSRRRCLTVSIAYGEAAVVGEPSCLLGWWRRRQKVP
jgi:hypothetical protein